MPRTCWSSFQNKVGDAPGNVSGCCTVLSRLRCTRHACHAHTFNREDVLIFKVPRVLVAEKRQLAAHNGGEEGTQLAAGDGLLGQASNDGIDVVHAVWAGKGVEVRE